MVRVPRLAARHSSRRGLHKPQPRARATAIPTLELRYPLCRVAVGSKTHILRRTKEKVGLRPDRYATDATNPTDAKVARLRCCSARRSSFRSSFSSRCWRSRFELGKDTSRTDTHPCADCAPPEHSPRSRL